MGRLTLTVLAAFVRFMAWLFAVVSVITIAAAPIVCITKVPARFVVMDSGNGTNDTTAWGLTYVGWSGAAIALAEVIAVVWALAASRSRKIHWRVAGHLALILWAGLWTLGAFHVFSDGTFSLIYVLPVFLACTLLRAALDPVTRRGWGHPPLSTPCHADCPPVAP